MNKRLSSRLVRNVLSVASGAAVAQIIVLAFSPLITRIYSPEVFGLQGIFLSLIGIFSPIIALRYPMAIIRVETSEDARNIARLSIIISATLSGLMWIALFVSGPLILELLGSEDIGALILFLPVALFLVALHDVWDFYATRLGHFRLIGTVAVFQALISNLARVLGGVIAPVAVTLVMVTTLSPAIKVALFSLRSREVRISSYGITRPAALALMKRHRDFPIYRMPTDVLNALSQSVPVLLLAAFFSPVAAGLYTLSRSVINLPTNIIGVAVGNVLYARFAEQSRDKRAILPLLRRATFGLLGLAPLFVFVAWFAPPVFELFFGTQWREAGQYAQWMSLWVALMIANVPAVRVLPVIERQGFVLVFNLVLLLSRVAAMVWAWWYYGTALAAVACYSITSVILISISILWTFSLVRRFDQRNLGDKI